LALLGSESFEELERRPACGRFEKLDRLVVELDRLHGEGTPRLVLDTTPTQRLAQLVARDREQPRLRRLRPRLEPRHRRERGGKGLGGQIESLLRAGRPPPEEGEHGGEVPLVEGPEGLRG
jgi:hypothetical protein